LKKKIFKILWPNGKTSQAYEGDDWFSMAKKVGLEIPTGCLTGSCGACEIEVNGEIIRPCISDIKNKKGFSLKIEFMNDPFW
tara:strand:+ start:1228 stop:1473 length:246 start_codon:yes stop_codon:yes gene_type:complete